MAAVAVDDDMARVRACLGQVALVLIDFRSGDVKARAEEEYKASMHAKMGMVLTHVNFMVELLLDRAKSKDSKIESVSVLWDQLEL